MNDTECVSGMSIQKHTLRAEMQECNRRIDQKLQPYGMSFQTYKVIKALTLLVGAASGVYAMSLGADPLIAFALIALIISGPEAFEYALSKQE